MTGRIGHLESISPRTRSPRGLSGLPAAWSDPDRRGDLLIGACALLTGLFALLTMIAAGYLNFTKLPMFDSWDLWHVRLTETSWWAFLTTTHNSHLIPVPRLLYLADEKWFHGNAELLLSLTFLSQIGTALILYRLACPGNATIELRATLLGLIFTFVFAAPQWINFTTALQVCFVLAFSTGIGALAALYRSATSTVHPRQAGAWLLLALVLALISVGTSANGLVVWPLLAVLALFLRMPRSVVATLTVLFLGFAFAYIHSYHPSTLSTAPDLFGTSPDMIAFALAYLGSALDEPVMAAAKAIGLNWEPYRVALTAIAGALGILWWVRITANAVVGRPSPSPGQITLLHVIAFLVGGAALTSFGRIQFTINAALTSRYTTPSVLFWVCLIALAIVRADSDSTSKKRRSAVQVGALLAGLLIGGLLQLPKVSYAIAAERYMRESEYAIINGAFEPNLWERFYYASGRMIPTVRYLREHKLASFSPGWTRWVGDSAPSHFVIGSTASDCIGSVESTNSLGNSFRPSAVSTGWAYDRRDRRAPTQVVFVDNGHHILGFASTTRSRPDVMKAHPDFSDDVIGWRAYLPDTEAMDATVYAILEEGKRKNLCPIGTTRLPGAYVVAPAAKAGEVIAGVRPDWTGAWVASLPPGAPKPPFPTEVWSSQLSQPAGKLRLGPVGVGEGARIGLPVVTGPGATDVRVSVMERSTKETLATAAVPAGTATWDLWRLDIPAATPFTLVDYVIETAGAGDWVVIGSPRYLNP
jgi:hypothetical protein